MPSARYRSLVLNIAKLEKRFLPKKLSGPFSLRQHDLARGFRLLAHAEIEAYLEDRARDVSLSALRKFKLTKKPHVVVLSLLAYQMVQSQLSDKYLKEHYRKQSDHIELVLESANKSYQYLLSQNHGIREDNVLSVLLPVGFKITDIDSIWLADMNSFGRTRGETAHTSFTAKKLVDPKTEKVTVDQLIKGLTPIDDVFSRLMQK